MRIINLKADNVKRLRAVDISPDRNMVVVGGNNAQGKSSVLDAIMYALSGGAAIPGRPVRDGADSAEITCELDGLVVRRTISAQGRTSLTVTNADGTARYSSPQKMLDDLVGRLTFDPLAFLRMKPADQLATLKDLVGLDFRDMDARRAALYDERTQANRAAKECEAQFKALPVPHDGIPDAPVSIQQLMGELREAERTNKVKDDACREVMDLRGNLDDYAERIEKAKGQIAAWQQTLATLESEQQQATEDHRQRYAEADAMPCIDIEPIRQRIESAEAVNKQVAMAGERAARLDRFQAARAQAETLTADIQKIDDEKASALAAAPFPVPGLAFGDEGVTFNGVPFEQASSAEQLRVSVGMAIAANPKLKVLLVRDGSLLDEDSMRIVTEMVKASDAQLWIERVGKGGGCTIIIEDGAVEAAEENDNEHSA